MTKGPEMASSELRIRPLAFVDLETRVKWFTDARMAPTMVFPEQITLARTREWFVGVQADDRREDFALVRDGDPGVLGFVGHRVVMPGGLPEIYVAAHPDRHGEGLGAAMIRLVVDRLRERPGVRGAVAEMYRTNAAVIRIFEKSGFVESDPPSDPSRMRVCLKW